MDNKAIYLQIADTIMERILDCSLGPESRLPSVRDYAATMEVNANTVMRSYDYLAGLGVIANRRGIGYFVAEGAVEIVRRKCADELMGAVLTDVMRRMALLGITPETLKQTYEEYLKRTEK